MQAVQVDRLTKRFGATVAVDRVSLSVASGEFFTLLGPSGCGKTTLLRLLAGLESPDAGEIRFGAERVDGRPAYERNIGMVFQNYAVFPHMTVFDNVAYGLRARRRPEPDLVKRVGEALAQVEMAEFADRRPDQLSGGQQQRVALARALAIRPGLLLMDEPLSNLDARLRVAMRAEIRAVQRQVGIATVYVTHDQEEALAISDRIGVMEGGRLVQVGTPYEIYHRPAHRSVAAFVGTCSFVAGEAAGRPIWLGLRPEALHPVLDPLQPVAPGEVQLEATVEGVTFLGAYHHVHARLETGERVTALLLQPSGAPSAGPSPGEFAPGRRIGLRYQADAALRFDRASGGALR